ncbi:hypothetical protein MTP99_003105 [Tenebrio molitor]|nr:hypothetical protein MTP99_003105 [Tenebrio molitor]
MTTTAMATKIVRYLEIPKISSNRLQCIVSVPKTKLTNFCQYRYEIMVVPAQELVLRLNGEERNILISALQEYQSKLVKDEYEGHYAKDCGRFRETQSKSAVSSSSTEGIKVLQIGSDTHRKYFKDALINGRPTKCYIDLGSSCVTIRLDLVEQMGYTYFETDLEPLVGYGQGVVKPIGMLTVDLTIDDVTAKVNAHVVPNDSQLVPVLVGHPYTEQPHVCIISTSDELMVRNGLSDFFNVNEANDKKTHISSSKQVTIPSNYLGHVSICSTVVNETLCIEGGIRENGHVIPRCVIEVDNEGKSALPVLNLSSKPLVFKEGDRITRGEICKIAEVDGKREINDEPISYEDIHTDLLEEDASVLLDMLNENKGFGLEENPLTQEIIQLNSEIQFNDEAEEEEIQSLLRKNQEKMKTQFDKKRREPPTYSEKDLVMMNIESILDAVQMNVESILDAVQMNVESILDAVQMNIESILG